jgi:RES domain-containing protein
LADLFPPHYRYSVQIPEEVRIEDLRLPAPNATQQWGTEWASEARSAVARVPSAVVPGELNFLLNPLHGELGQLVIQKHGVFAFDPRLAR